MSASRVVRRGVVSFALSSVAALGVSAQSPTGRPLAIEDYYRVKTVGNPELSPDGKWVAFTVSTRVEATNDNTSEVWLVPSDGSAPARRVSADGANAAIARVAGRRPPAFLGGWTRVRPPTRDADGSHRRRHSRTRRFRGRRTGRWTRRARWWRRRARDAELRRNHERDRSRHAAAEARAGLRIRVREATRGALQGRRVRLDGFPARRGAVSAPESRRPAGESSARDLRHAGRQRRATTHAPRASSRWCELESAPGRCSLSPPTRRIATRWCTAAATSGR